MLNYSSIKDSDSLVWGKGTFMEIHACFPVDSLYFPVLFHTCIGIFSDHPRIYPTSGLLPDRFL